MNYELQDIFLHKWNDLTFQNLQIQIINSSCSVTSLELFKSSKLAMFSLFCAFITQRDQQIIDLNPGLNYNVTILNGDQNFQNRKNIHVYITVASIVVRLLIVMPHDTVLSL